jgi:hypothetical protein
MQPDGSFPWSQQRVAYHHRTSSESEDMEGALEHNELDVEDSRHWAILQIGAWAWGEQLVIETNSLRNITEVSSNTGYFKKSFTIVFQMWL